MTSPGRKYPMSSAALSSSTSECAKRSKGGLRASNPSIGDQGEPCERPRRRGPEGRAPLRPRRLALVGVGAGRAEAGFRPNELRVVGRLLLLGALARVHLREEPDSQEGDGHGEQGRIVVRENF